MKDASLQTKKLLFWSSVVAFIALDQIVKAWARSTLHIGEALPFPFPGKFEIQLTYNQGIAFGLFQGKGLLLAPIAVAISAGSIYYTAKHPEESRWNHVAFGLLAGGAIGNLIDRIWLGHVTDMFWFRAIDFPVFNVADSCITIATIMLIIGWWQEAAQRKPAPVETEPRPAE